MRAVDLFAGAGGTSTGLAQAAETLGLPLELTAINHWQVAVESHAANHPFHETRAQAERVARKIKRESKPSSVVVDRLDVHMSREGVVAALNHAHVSRVNWAGVEVLRL